MEHSFVEWLEFCLQSKIKESKRGKRGCKFVMNHCTLAKIMDEIEEQTHGKIEEQTKIKNIIDFQFEKFAAPYFKRMFTIYLFLYSTAFYTQIKAKNISVQRGCAVSCLLVQSCLLFLEYIQMRKTTFRDYIKDSGNKLDLSVIIMNFVYFSNKHIL